MIQCMTLKKNSEADENLRRARPKVMFNGLVYCLVVAAAEDAHDEAFLFGGYMKNDLFHFGRTSNHADSPKNTI